MVGTGKYPLFQLKGGGQNDPLPQRVSRLRSLRSLYGSIYETA